MRISTFAVALVAMAGTAPAAFAQDAAGSPSYFQLGLGGGPDSAGFNLTYGRDVSAFTLEAEVLALGNVRQASNDEVSAHFGVAGLVNAVVRSREGRFRPYGGLGLGTSTGGGLFLQGKAGFAVQTFKRQAVTFEARVLGGTDGDGLGGTGLALIGYRFGG
ncbi:hypothetical protein [Parvularcula dongshanensis]|uniref:Outer membrane protein beta-barrel domain-containing protein n=1 Tax=Parvularcula dongshanensis TaxID=1173995 RepID=A0A840I036_9PROT|nr:hypothetical protein [Parvularcula dongshanensis]MBB4657528.1 hypothetical protein [Parvularcula dongshanensis]